MLVETKKFSQDILFYENIDEKDIKKLHNEDGIDFGDLAYVSDARERARVEFDEKHNTWTLIYNVPTRVDRPLFAPIGIVCNAKNIFVFLSTNTAFVMDAFSSVLENNQNDETDDDPKTLTTWSLIFDVLYILSTQYFDLINKANAEREKLDERMQVKTSNESIMELANLSKAFVFILTSLNANVVALKSLQLYERRLNTKLQLTDSENEHLDDVLIEAEQAQEMVQLYSDITDKMTNNYNNLINNNMNNIMKFLTIYSIVLTVPTIITGFFGMNVALPFADSAWSWVITIVITIFFSLVVWYLMKKKNLM